MHTTPSPEIPGKPRYVPEETPAFPVPETPGPDSPRQPPEESPPHPDDPEGEGRPSPDEMPEALAIRIP